MHHLVSELEQLANRSVRSFEQFGMYARRYGHELDMSLNRTIGDGFLHAVERSRRAMVRAVRRSDRAKDRLEEERKARAKWMGRHG